MVKNTWSGDERADGVKEKFKEEGNGEKKS